MFKRLFTPLFFAVVALPALAADRPNILWITVEDMSSDLGCYGVPHADTPHIDRFASQGVLYTHAFATIGVCAPARSTIITGMYPTSLGTQHMRCTGTLPDFVKCFPEYLRNADYYCTNNSKEDYNFKTPKTTWDESSRKAHWRGRKGGQPFFAVINITTTHESQGWDSNAQTHRAKLSSDRHHDPAAITIPPYHPDTPRVRRDWANYHDNISVMDQEVAEILKDLEDDGLADDTIVFFYSDHGAGMPRSKRWLYDSSLRVPFIVRFPEKYKHLAPASPGSRTDRLISFVDLAPTVLSLAGVDIPEHMQGSAFLGPQSGKPREYIYGFRDRMDERYDMIRAVRDRKYKYIRNFQPHKPYFHGQYLEYANRMPTLRVWQEMSKAGTLNEVQAQWMGESKPAEELYDTEADPWETRNLAEAPEYAETLGRMRAELRRWMIDTKDLGLLPEYDMRTRFGDRTAYEAVRADPSLFPVEELLGVAETPAWWGLTLGPNGIGNVPDPGVRWWRAAALFGATRKESDRPSPFLVNVLNDPSPDIRIEAAESLAQNGEADKALPVLEAAMKHDNEWVRLRAMNAIDNLDAIAEPLRPLIEAALKDKSGYVVRAAEHALKAFE